MPPALDRLLASPSALRVLRAIVNAPELPSACLSTTNCCRSVAQRRKHVTSSRSLRPVKWRRWHESVEVAPDPETTPLVRDANPPTVDPESFRDDLPEDLVPGGIEAEGGISEWAERLALQERIYNLNGIREVWSTYRLRGYSLPTEDSLDAQFLWGTFVKHPELVIPVIDHAADLLKETGTTYPHVYELVMGHWLLRKSKNKDLKDIEEYHHHMLMKLGLKKLPLRHLARLGRSRYKPWTYEAFMRIYRASNERNVYDEIVPPLCKSGHITMARRWHTLCFHRDDLPSPSVAAHPIVQVFSAETSTISNPEPHFETRSTSQSTQMKRPRYNEELMRRLLGRDTAPVRFEDSFCARMFATRAFPPDSIIKGLAMVGVNEIGPQAVLAMASRTIPIEELPKRFEELRAVGIALQGCVFSLALEKFAVDKKWHLVRSILESDQHPDVFGDADLQKKLMHYYLDQGDSAQAHRTLAILTLFYNDPSNEAWNLLLQTHVKRVEPQQTVQVIQDMRANGVEVTAESMLVIKGLLRRRQRGHKPITTTSRRFDDLRFVTRVFIMVLESGIGHIPPITWREILRRYGMLGRFRELRRLILWLLCWYAPGSTQFAKLPRSPYLDKATEKLRAAYPERNHYFHFPAKESQLNELHPIRQLFPPSFIQGLISWGFRAGLLPNAPFEQSMFSTTMAKKHYRRRFRGYGILNHRAWSSGLETVVELRDLGVHVHLHTVVKGLQMQFVNLFGRGHSRRKENRVMEQANTIPYVDYVHQVNEIWGSPLFGVPQSLQDSKLHGRVWRPNLPRRMYRRTWANLTMTEVLASNGRVDHDAHQQNVNNKKNSTLDELRSTFRAQARALRAQSMEGSDAVGLEPTVGVQDS